MSLLPSRGPDVSTSQEGEMDVVGVDEDVEPILDALASETARTVLNSIYDDPGTPSELADRLDMSIQKISYHLQKLEERDLIAVAGTRYSEKGQEMTVYEPPEEPLVLFVGTDERKDSLKTMIERLLPTVGVLALASIAIQQFSGGTVVPRLFSKTGGSHSGSTSDVQAGATNSGSKAVTETAGTHGGSGNFTIESTHAPASATPTPVSSGVHETTTHVTEAVAGGTALELSPGIAFFLGGLLVLVILVGWWGYRRYTVD